MMIFDHDSQNDALVGIMTCEQHKQIAYSLIIMMVMFVVMIMLMVGSVRQRLHI